MYGSCGTAKMNPPKTGGGIYCNKEISYYYYDNNDNQKPNSSLTTQINAFQLDSLIEYWNTNSYYSLANHNCTTVAIYSWYRVSNVRFAVDLFIPMVLKTQIEANGGSELDLSDILPHV